MNANLALGGHIQNPNPEAKTRNYPKTKLRKFQIPKNSKLYPNPKTQDPNVLCEFSYWYIPNWARTAS
jgi:hypothetical protein